MDSVKKSFDDNFRKTWDGVYSDTSDKSIFKSRLTGKQAKTLENGYAVLYSPDILAKKPPKPKVDVPTDYKPEQRIPFDETKWNFTKINPSCLFALYDSRSGSLTFDTTELIERPEQDRSIYNFYINEYPLAMYHSLIVPDPTLKYPQVFRRDCFLDILKMYYNTFDTDNYGIGYNSGDVASVNNLHFQILRLSEFYEGSQTAIETAERETLMKINSSDLQGDNEILIQDLIDFGIRGCAIQLPEGLSKDSPVFEDIIRICERMVDVMIENKISHNVIFIKNSLYIMPCRIENPNRPACVQRGWIELTGLSKCMNQEAYDTSPDGETIKKLYREHISLDESSFEELQKDMLSSLKGLRLRTIESLLPDLETLMRKSSSQC